MKKSLMVLVFLVSALAFAAPFAPAYPAEVEKGVDTTVIFFMPIGSPIDPFILMAEKGISSATTLYQNLKIARVYPYSDDYIHEYIKYSAMRGHKYIVGIGSYYNDAFDKVADQFPDKNFIVIDGKSKKKNVKSFVFNNYEAGALAGLVAATVSKSRKVGFIGGRETGIIVDIQKGFADTARKTDPSIQVMSKYLSKDNTGFADEKAGFAAADEMYKSGCDIVFAAAGSSGRGSIDAARANGKYIIAMDSDQDAAAKGTVITSVMKRLDSAIINLLQDISTGKFDRSEVSFNVGNVGFALTSFTYSKDSIPKAKLDKIYDGVYEMKRKYEYSEASKIRDTDSTAPAGEKKPAARYVPGRLFRK